MKISKLVGMGTLCILVACSAGPQERKKTVTGATNTKDKEQVRIAIQKVIDASIARATEQSPDGHKYVLDRPMPTNEEQEQIQKLGDTAIEVLSEYSSKGNALQQRPALMLLGRFKSDEALAVIVQFAEHSQIRGHAVANLCSFPLSKTLPVLERFAKSSNSDVQRAANRCLESQRIPQQP